MRKSGLKVVLYEAGVSFRSIDGEKNGKGGKNLWTRCADLFRKAPDKE